MEDINKVLSNIGRHALHLYTPDINKYAIQIPFLAQGKEKRIYITSDVKTAANELKGMKVDITKPEEFKASRRNTRIVVDAIPSFLKFEEKFQNLKCSVLCTYDLTKLDSAMLSQLAKLHDKLILTTESATILSGERVQKLEKLDEKGVEKFVKSELPAIVLALILNKPICGRDITKVLHKKFNVLISPGSLYPLLKDLEKKGLLSCEYGIKNKNKIYRVKKKENVKEILNRHLQASRFVLKFLEKSA